MKLWMILLIVVVSFIALFLFGSELNRASILGSDGHIESGSKFGLHIGMDSRKVESLLTRERLTLYESSMGGQCLDRAYPVEQKLEVWTDDGWRKGTLCVSYVNQKVVSLGWYYYWAQP